MHVHCDKLKAFTGQSRNVHIMAGIFSMDNLYLAGKTPLLAGDMLVNFGDTLPETSKSSACWNMGRVSGRDAWSRTYSRLLMLIICVIFLILKIALPLAIIWVAYYYIFICVAFPIFKIAKPFLFICATLAITNHDQLYIVFNVNFQAITLIGLNSFVSNIESRNSSPQMSDIL